MLFVDLVLSLVIAAVVVALLARWRRERGRVPGVGLLYLLLLTFPVIWALGVLVSPLGPAYGGISWLGFVLVGGLVLLLLLAAGAPSQPRRDEASVIPENAGSEATVATAMSFGLFFWLLMVAAILVLLYRYVGEPPIMGGGQGIPEAAAEELSGS